VETIVEIFDVNRYFFLHFLAFSCSLLHLLQYIRSELTYSLPDKINYIKDEARPAVSVMPPVTMTPVPEKASANLTPVNMAAKAKDAATVAQKIEAPSVATTVWGTQAPPTMETMATATGTTDSAFVQVTTVVKTAADEKGWAVSATVKFIEAYQVPTEIRLPTELPAAESTIPATSAANLAARAKTTEDSFWTLNFLEFIARMPKL
jgi:hypothetical protein